MNVTTIYIWTNLSKNDSIITAGEQLYYCFTAVRANNVISYALQKCCCMASIEKFETDVSTSVCN